MHRRCEGARVSRPQRYCSRRAAHGHPRERFRRRHRRPGVSGSVTSCSTSLAAAFFTGSSMRRRRESGAEKPSASSVCRSRRGRRARRPPRLRAGRRRLRVAVPAPAGGRPGTEFLRSSLRERFALGITWREPACRARDNNRGAALGDALYSPLSRLPPGSRSSNDYWPLSGETGPTRSPRKRARVSSTRRQVTDSSHGLRAGVGVRGACRRRCCPRRIPRTPPVAPRARQTGSTPAR